MIIFRKAHITLVEMMMVIGLLTLIAGVVGINVRRMISEQRFNTEVSLVVDELRLAQELMLLLHTDTQVNFRHDQENGGIKYWIEIEKTLSKEWMLQLTKQRPNLKAIHLVEFDDQLKGTKEKEYLEIRFFSGGSVMSRGILHLSSSDTPNTPPEDVLDSYICLLGYPAPIASTSNKLDKTICDSQKDVDYFEKLTFNTMRDIADRKPRVSQNAPIQKK